MVGRFLNRIFCVFWNFVMFVFILGVVDFLLSSLLNLGFE